MNKNDAEISTWVNDHSEKLLNRAHYLLSNKQDALDMVQEVFLGAHLAKNSFDGKSNQC